MSFVSIVARQNWISVVSDGRCMFDGDITDEHYQKFIQPAVNSFIAFAGNKEPCEVVIRGMQELGHVNLGVEEAAKHMMGMVRMLGSRGYELFMAIGGIGSSGTEIYAMSTQFQTPIIQRPGPEDVCYTFLSNTCVTTESLNRQLTA